MRKSFRCFLRMRSRFWDLTNMQRFFFFLNWIVKHLSNFQAWEFLSFLFTHTIGHLRMNFRGQSGESPLRLTPQFDEHKSQSAVSGSVVYKKTPAPFKMGKERGGKVRWQKAGRRHYEPAMSDELFRDSNRPRATWFIDCSERKKKVPIWAVSRTVYSLSRRENTCGRRSSDFGQTPVDLRPVGLWGALQQKAKAAAGDTMASGVNHWWEDL